MNTMEIGQGLVELCKQGEYVQAIKTYYADDVVSLEPAASPGHEQETSGKPAVLAKTEWWAENHEVHDMSLLGPFPHGDRFALYFKIDVTAKSGEMAGNRFVMEEVGVYTVNGGKIIREEFFYHMG